MDKTLKIRPYARLLTMLGEQLIKNEQIALAELIKNSYDADAEWVKVRFVDFGTITRWQSRPARRPDGQSVRGRESS